MKKNEIVFFYSYFFTLTFILFFTLFLLLLVRPRLLNAQDQSDHISMWFFNLDSFFNDVQKYICNANFLATFSMVSTYMA
jgi:hypothetical protein